MGVTRVPFTHQFDAHDLVGRYLAVVFCDDHNLTFYISNFTDFAQDGFAFEYYDTMYKDAVDPYENDLSDLKGYGYWNFNPEPQSLSFVNEEDGDVFLIGAHNDGTVWDPEANEHKPSAPVKNGRDIMILWEVRIDPGEETVDLRGVYGSLHNASHKVLKSQGELSLKTNICSDTWGRNLKLQEAKFSAGAGAYVSPSGELLYYATSYWSLGPGAITRMAELRHSEVSHTGTCGPQFRDNHLGGPHSIPEASDLALNGEVYVIEPWVQMYTDTDHEKSSVMLDWEDRMKDDYHNCRRLDGWSDYRIAGVLVDHDDCKSDGFNDCLSSFRFCGPAGSTLEVFDDDADESWEEAKEGNRGWFSCDGTGNVISVADVEHLPSGCQHHGDGDQDDFNDEATSARFLWTPPTETYQWQVEGVGHVEPIEGGKRAIFHAHQGSSTDTVKLTVGGVEVSALVEVYNVPPIFDSITIVPSPADEGQEVTLTAAWSDPGAPVVTVSIDWGDGIAEDKIGECDECNLGHYSGSVDSHHFYADNGIYSIHVCVNDGEDSACTQRVITVNNVAPTVDAGLDQVIYEGDALTLDPATSNDKGTLDTHTATVDWGDGSPVEPARCPRRPSARLAPRSVLPALSPAPTSTLGRRESMSSP